MLPALPPICAGCRCVLLRHDLPDGTWHMDWLIEPAPPARDVHDDPARRDVLTFRLDQRLDAPPEGGTLHAERIADHRRLYLSHEGLVSGGRGQVVRLAEGEVLHCESQPDGGTSLIITWHARDSHRPAITQTLTLVQQRDPHWLVSCVQTDGAAE